MNQQFELGDVVITSWDKIAGIEHLFELWQECFADSWPIRLGAFTQKVSHDTATTFVARYGDQIIGLLTQNEDHLVAIVVRPEFQRMGVGRLLIEKASMPANIGGGNSYFWPGVPLNLPGAVLFFEALGYAPGEKATDMVTELQDYVVPDDITEKITKSGVTVRLSTLGDKDTIRAFEDKYFPEWSATAFWATELGNYQNILLAFDGEKLIGTSFLFCPDDSNYDSEFAWDKIIGDQTGGYGAVGVMPEARGKYAGFALATEGELLLKKRGVKKSYLAWVFSTDWYERLGYKTWRQYQEMSKKLDQ